MDGKKVKKGWKQYWLCATSLILFACLGCTEAYPQPSGERPEETAGISVEDIYASETNMATLYFEPKAYEGKRIGVAGYLELNGKDSALYMTQEDYIYKNRENAVLFDGDTMEKDHMEGTGSSLQQYQGKIVGVMGDVSFKDRKEGIAYLKKPYFLYEQNMPVQEEQKEAIPITEEFSNFYEGTEPEFLDEWTYGDGSSKDKAILISYYRYLNNPFAYQGKYIETQLVVKIVSVGGGWYATWLPDERYLENSTLIYSGLGSLWLGKEKEEDPVSLDKVVKDMERFNCPSRVRVLVETVSEKYIFEGEATDLPTLLDATTEKLDARSEQGEE